MGSRTPLRMTAGKTNCRCAPYTSIAIASLALGVALTVALAGEPVNAKITLESLVLLAKKWNSESSAQAKTEIAKNILDVGVPLLAESMAASRAESVAQARKSGGQLSEDQRRYVGFWLLRARAAVESDNREAGVQAAKILIQLGMNQSDKPEEIKIMVALNVKGWLNAPDSSELQKLQAALKAGDLKTAAQEADALFRKYPQNAKVIAWRDSIRQELEKPSPAEASTNKAVDNESSDEDEAVDNERSEEDKTVNDARSEEHTYEGNVGPYDATFNLRFEPNRHVSGTYTVGSRNVILRLEGENPEGRLILKEYTHAELTARIELSLDKSASDIRWEGTMYNTPPDNRVFHVVFARPRN